MSKRNVDNIGTRTVVDGDVVAHYHTNGNLYVHGAGPLKPEDLQWLMQKKLSKVFKEGKQSKVDWNPYENDYLSKE